MKLSCFLFFSLISVNIFSSELATYPCKEKDSYCTTDSIEMRVEDYVSLGNYVINGSSTVYIFGLPISDIYVRTTYPVKCVVEYRLNFENQKNGKKGTINEKYTFETSQYFSESNANSDKVKQEEYRFFKDNEYSLKSISLIKSTCTRGSRERFSEIELCQFVVSGKGEYYFMKKELGSLLYFLKQIDVGESEELSVCDYLIQDKPIEKVSKIHLKSKHQVEGWLSILNSVLSKLTNLKELNLSDVDISNINLTKNTQLTSLNIGNTKITDISSFSTLINLEYLSIAGTNVSDIGSLKNTTSLKDLNLSNTNVVDTSSLSNLSKLEILDLSDTSVFDLDSLKYMKSLKFLDVSNTKVVDIGSVSSLPELFNLNLSGTSVRDFEALKNIKSLHFLDISDTEINDISSLSIPYLESLKLSGTKVANIDVLKDHLGIRFLDISNTKIVDFGFLFINNSFSRLTISSDQELYVDQYHLPRSKIIIK